MSDKSSQLKHARLSSAGTVSYWCRYLLRVQGLYGLSFSTRAARWIPWLPAELPQGFFPNFLLKFFSRFVLDFVFKALLVDARGSCVPAQGTHILRLPVVAFTLFSLRHTQPTHRQGVHVRGPSSGRSMAHRVCSSALQRTTSLTTSGVAGSSCWSPSSRKPEDRSGEKGDFPRNLAESACRFGFRALGSS